MRDTPERLILNEDAEILARLEPDTPEWDRYFRKVRVTQQRVSNRHGVTPVHLHLPAQVIRHAIVHHASPRQRARSLSISQWRKRVGSDVPQ